VRFDGGRDCPIFESKLVDVRSLLPSDWKQQVSATVSNRTVYRQHPPTPLISREDRPDGHTLRGRVSASAVLEELPWLPRLFRTSFCALAADFAREPVVPAEDYRYGVVLNVQSDPTMRFECHVDSNPVSGLLFFTSHPLGEGGELVISYSPDAYGIQQIEENCSIVVPSAGYLLLFKGRLHSHYARPLAWAGAIRIVAPMNFYTREFPESDRPAVLNEHRFKTEV
jgi:hypothetical protein